MKGSRFCLIAFVILLSSLKTSAQSSGSFGRETNKGEVDFTELAKYELAHPVPVVRKPPFDEDEAEDQIPYHRPATGAAVHMMRKNTARGVKDSTGPDFLTASPAPEDTFMATITTGANIPSDTHGGVDSNYCVTVTNTAVHILDRRGKNISSASLDGFWAAVLPATTGSFDPRVHFDPYNNRWIMVSDAVTSGTMSNSYLLIAVSKTSSPTGKWWTYAVSIDATNKAWLDYPCVGFNNKWIVISGNFFANSAGGQTGAAVYAFDYAAARAGSGATYKKFSQSASFTIAPALTYDANEPNVFCVDVANSNAGQLEMFKISGSVSSPTMTSLGNPTSTTRWHNSGPGGNDFAPQATIANKFDCGDSRISNCVYRNGKVWCSHNVFLPAPLIGAATRSSVMWWQIDTFAGPLQNGLIDNSTGPQFYAYPSITANQYDDALIGFSHFSSAGYADAGYALHLHTDPAGSTQSVNIYRHGQAPYFQNYGSGKNRWGDYSGTCIDPRNHTDFWTVQESVPSTPANFWDTWWAYVVVCGANAKFTVASDTVEALTSDVLTFTGTAAAGTTYTWLYSGGTAVPGTGAGPQTIKWSGSGWKIITLATTVNGCTTYVRDSVYVKKNVGVSEVAAVTNNVSIVPNPNEGSFSVVFDNPVNKKVAIKITDLQGRVVYNNDFGMVIDNRLPVVTDNLSTGNYIVTILTDNAEITKKIIISR